MLRVDLVEPVPDGAVIVEIEPAGEGDLRCGRQQHLGVGASLGSEEIAAVDHRRSQRAVIDHRPGARPPSGPSVALEVVGGLIAEEFHRVAALDKGQALRCKALEFDGADLRAVLLFLAAPLPLLVVVELALDPVDSAMEDINRRPEQVFEVGFKSRVAQGGNEGVEDVCDSATDCLGFGQLSRIRFVLERTVAEELQFREDLIGR
jgi:hypothetical protein